MPCPAVAVTWVLYVLPFDIAVNSAIPMLLPNTVVHPNCEADALAAHVYSTRPLQYKVNQSIPIP